jgi:hypothetical protein
MPTKKQLEVFIDTFMRLSQHEGEHRALRGWGCFREDENLPIPEVMTVLAWLNEYKDTIEK